jgi:hypothetical protein
MSSSGKIVNLVNPSSNQDAATKYYVDTQVSTASSAASAAQTTANTAVTNAATAQTTANTAVTKADAGQSSIQSIWDSIAFGSATASAQYLYPATGSGAGIYTNGNNRLYVTTDGKIGIGTTTPAAPLHVYNTVAMSSPGYFSYLGLGSMTTWTLQNYSTNLSNMSVIIDGSLWIKGLTILFSSDKRIKKNIKEIAGNDALSQIRKLRPTIYNNIDVTKEQGDVYGFIAQEVEDVITNSTKKTKDYIPNIYCKGDISVLDASKHIYEISSENELRFEKVLDDKGSEITNYKIKIYDDTNKEYICTVINTINVNTIHVKCDKDYNFSIVEEHKNKVFIYGQEVNDFNILDKNIIYTVVTAALKEVDRQQQADKARIAELETTVATQQSLINDIIERLKALEKA